MRDRIPVVRQVTGVVVTVGTSLRVNVNGAVLPPLPWPAGYIPAAGDLVSVDVVDGRGRVTGPVVRGTRPLTGTVTVAASGGYVTVAATGGPFLCRYAGTAPTVGSVVRLAWDASEPWVWPTIPAPVTAAPSGSSVDAPAPPPTVDSGWLYVTATGSGGYNSSQGWYSPNPIQGTYGGSVWQGGWFYGAKPSQLRGRTVTRFQFRLPRMSLGTSPLTVYLYRHTSSYRPSGGLSRVAGPSTASASSSARWITLPTSWGQAIVDSGGGIGIYGGAFGSLLGIGSDAASGQLRIDWRS